MVLMIICIDFIIPIKNLDLFILYIFFSKILNSWIILWYISNYTSKTDFVALSIYTKSI